MSTNNEDEAIECVSENVICASSSDCCNNMLCQALVGSSLSVCRVQEGCSNSTTTEAPVSTNGNLCAAKNMFCSSSSDCCGGLQCQSLNGSSLNVCLKSSGCDSQDAHSQ